MPECAKAYLYSSLEFQFFPGKIPDSLPLSGGGKEEENGEVALGECKGLEAGA